MLDWLQRACGWTHRYSMPLCLTARPSSSVSAFNARRRTLEAYPRALPKNPCMLHFLLYLCPSLRTVGDLFGRCAFR